MINFAFYILASVILLRPDATFDLTDKYYYPELKAVEMFIVHVIAKLNYYLSSSVHFTMNC